MGHTEKTMDFWRKLYAENRDCILVLLSQLFAVFLNSSAKSLQTAGSTTVQPLQILGIRMIFTVVASMCYPLWRRSSSNTKSQSPPEKETSSGKGSALRTLLVVRGIAGAFGVIGFYCKFL
ncbi:hypothetical protein N7490_002124 [Penicillium lividum]|nr:hypothetical protein N7490_002124 [Penicillium lividum]